MVPMAFGNLAMDLILDGVSGRLVNVRNGRYDNVPIDVVTSRKKVVGRRQVLQHRAPASQIHSVRGSAGLSS